MYLPVPGIKHTSSVFIAKCSKVETHQTCVGVYIHVCVHSLAYGHAFSINSPVLILRRFRLHILCIDIESH